MCVGDACLWPLLLLLGDAHPTQHFFCLSSSSHSTNMTKQVNKLGSPRREGGREGGREGEERREGREGGRKGEREAGRQGGGREGRGAGV